MALAKDHHQTPSCSSFYGNMLEAGSSLQFPHISPYGFDNYNKKGDRDALESPNSNKMVMSSSPPLSSSSSANSSNGSLVIHHHHHPHTSNNYQPHEEANSLINFKPGYENFMQSGGGSLLSFQQEDNTTNTTFTNDHHHYHHHQMWEGSTSSSGMSQDHLKLIKNNCNSNLRLLEEVNCLQTSSDGGGGYQDEEAHEWLYAEAITDPSQESGTQQTSFNKRPHMVYS